MFHLTPPNPRRSWTTEEERRTQVQFLATQTDAEGKSFTNQQIADAVGDICEATVRSDKSKAATSQNYEVAVPPATRSKGKDGRSYSPPATEAEKAKVASVANATVAAPRASGANAPVAVPPSGVTNVPPDTRPAGVPNGTPAAHPNFT